MKVCNNDVSLIQCYTAFCTNLALYNTALKKKCWIIHSKLFFHLLNEVVLVWLDSEKIYDYDGSLIKYTLYSIHMTIQL